MTNPIIHLHNLETGEIVEREMNAQELAQYKKDQAAQAIAKVEAEAKATARADLLAKLGITAEEAALLLS